MKNELKGKTTATTARKASAAKSTPAKEEKAADVTTTVKVAAEKAVEKTEKAVATVAEKTGKTAEKVAAKAEKTAEKVVDTAVKAAKKAPAKKTAVKETVFLQYLGKEINKEDLMKQVKEIWTKEMKKKVSDLKSVTLYLKPEENAAYYVINDDVTGKIEF